MSEQMPWDKDPVTIDAETMIENLTVVEAETFRKTILLQYHLEGRTVSTDLRDELNRIVWLAKKRRAEECMAATEAMHQLHIQTLEQHRPYKI